MKVSDARLAGAKRIACDEKEIVPCTFFDLEPSEKMKYNTFRTRHRQLEAAINGMALDVRQRREKEVQEVFLDLISPFMEESGLKATSCFSYYGNNGNACQTVVDTCPYRLFEGNNPYDMTLGTILLFSTKPDSFSCTARLKYDRGLAARSPRTGIIYDMLGRVAKERTQDGFNFPIIKMDGFIKFASASMALPLMRLIKDVLERVGPEMDEISILYNEYMQYASRDSADESSGISVQHRIFKEAYERKLESSLAIAGYVEQKLTRIK
jgi:hypothetical protein